MKLLDPSRSVTYGNDDPTAPAVEPLSDFKSSKYFKCHNTDISFTAGAVKREKVVSFFQRH
ncbi:MAG: hypothetical protein U9O64_08440 [Campylobacterota bacterium]|nr:hypothetical protein [Campylobacterota bacterium]